MRVVMRRPQRWDSDMDALLRVTSRIAWLGISRFGDGPSAGSNWGGNSGAVRCTPVLLGLKEFEPAGET